MPRHPSFQPGDVIWAHLEGYPWWPSYITLPEPAHLKNLNIKDIPPGMHLVWFFSDNDRYSLMDERRIRPWEDEVLQNKARSFRGRVRKAYIEAVQWLEEVSREHARKHKDAAEKPDAELGDSSPNEHSDVEEEVVDEGNERMSPKDGDSDHESASGGSDAEGIPEKRKRPPPKAKSEEVDRDEDEDIDESDRDGESSSEADSELDVAKQKEHSKPKAESRRRGTPDESDVDSDQRGKLGPTKDVSGPGKAVSEPVNGNTGVKKRKHGSEDEAEDDKRKSTSGKSGKPRVESDDEEDSDDSMSDDSGSDDSDDDDDDDVDDDDDNDDRGTARGKEDGRRESGKERESSREKEATREKDTGKQKESSRDKGGGREKVSKSDRRDERRERKATLEEREQERSRKGSASRSERKGEANKKRRSPARSEEKDTRKRRKKQGEKATYPDPKPEPEPEARSSRRRAGATDSRTKLSRPASGKVAEKRPVTKKKSRGADQSDDEPNEKVVNVEKVRKAEGTRVGRRKTPARRGRS